MAIRILTANDIRNCLRPLELVSAVEAAFREVSDSQAVMPVRLTMGLGAPGAIEAVMPVLLPRSRALATKIVTVFPDNPRRGLPLILGVVLLSNPETGQPMALLDGAAITELRTAAGSAASARALARQDSRILTVVGAGVQAASHIRAIAGVLRLSEVRVVSRRAAAAEELVARLRVGTELSLVASSSVRDAVRDSDIVVLATTASDPVIEFAWLAPGTHLCAIGSHSPSKRELDTETVAKSNLIVVDTRPGALAEAGDLQVPIAESRVSPDRVVEMGEVLLGRHPGRQSKDDITIYKSVGMAAMDAAAAKLAYESAITGGVGVDVSF